MTTPTTHLLVLYGGGGTEHEVSARSVRYIEESLALAPTVEVRVVEILPDLTWQDRTGTKVQLQKNFLQSDDDKSPPWKVDFAIPCIHGFPGETGDIQSLLTLHRIPYWGSSAEGHLLCFNKASTKLWLDAFGIPNTPYLILHEASDQAMQSLQRFFEQHQTLFLKATNQGSSVGCFKIQSVDQLRPSLLKALELSPYAIAEKAIVGRELEVAVYEYEGKIKTTLPGEIVCPPNGHYTYEEKYSQLSHTTTLIEAPNVPSTLRDQMRVMAAQAFAIFKLRHLARIDFFLTPDGKIYLNEINTIPGLTSISMFPKMLEHNGDSFAKFLLASCQQKSDS